MIEIGRFDTLPYRYQSGGISTLPTGELQAFMTVFANSLSDRLSQQANLSWRS